MQFLIGLDWIIFWTWSVDCYLVYSVYIFVSHQTYVFPQGVYWEVVCSQWWGNNSGNFPGISKTEEIASHQIWSYATWAKWQCHVFYIRAEVTAVNCWSVLKITFPHAPTSIYSCRRRFPLLYISISGISALFPIPKFDSLRTVLIWTTEEDRGSC